MVALKMDLPTLFQNGDKPTARGFAHGAAIA